MKNLLYVIAGLLIVIWGIVFIGFNAHSTVHLILALAAIIILIRIVMNTKRSGK